MHRACILYPVLHCMWMGQVYDPVCVRACVLVYVCVCVCVCVCVLGVGVGVHCDDEIFTST